MTAIKVSALRIAYEAVLLDSPSRYLNATAEIQLRRGDGGAISLPIKITDIGMLSRLQSFFDAGLPVPATGVRPTDSHQSEESEEPTFDSIPSEVLELSERIRQSVQSTPQDTRPAMSVRVEPLLTDEADEANAGLRSI